MEGRPTYLFVPEGTLETLAELKAVGFVQGSYSELVAIETMFKEKNIQPGQVSAFVLDEEPEVLDRKYRQTNCSARLRGDDREFWIEDDKRKLAKQRRLSDWISKQGKLLPKNDLKAHLLNRSRERMRYGDGEVSRIYYDLVLNAVYFLITRT